jgi:hypothetical protein
MLRQPEAVKTAPKTMAMLPTAKTRPSRSIDVTSSFLGACLVTGKDEANVSSGSFQGSDEWDAADCNPLRDRTFEVLPDVVPNEWPGEKTKASQGINSTLPRRWDHTAFGSPVKRNFVISLADDRAIAGRNPAGTEDPLPRPPSLS